MGFMSRLHWEIFSEPSPDSEFMRMGQQEYPKEKRESEACRIKAKEKALLVKEKCARVVQRLRAQASNGSH